MRRCIYETTYAITIIAKAIAVAIELTKIAVSLPLLRQTKRAITVLKKPKVVANLDITDVGIFVSSRLEMCFKRLN